MGAMICPIYTAGQRQDQCPGLLRQSSALSPRNLWYSFDLHGQGVWINTTNLLPWWGNSLYKSPLAPCSYACTLTYTRVCTHTRRLKLLHYLKGLVLFYHFGFHLTQCLACYHFSINSCWMHEWMMNINGYSSSQDSSGLHHNLDSEAQLDHFMWGREKEEQ